MMVKCWVSNSELQIEENSVVMKGQGKYYHVALVRVQYMSTLRMGV